jgi:hypothetical protein
MGAAASAINHSDLTNDEKVLITKVNMLHVNLIFVRNIFNNYT